LKRELDSRAKAILLLWSKITGHEFDEFIAIDTTVARHGVGGRRLDLELKSLGSPQK